MKKVLAVFLTVVMLFGVCAFSSSAEGETPTVSIITNDGSPVTSGTKTCFTVRFDNFTPIKGVDVTVKADKGAVLGSVTTYNFKEDKAQENVNYTKTSDTVRFVDLLKSGASNARISIEVTAASESANITVTGKYADSGTTLFEIASASGVLEVKTEVPTTSIPEESTKLDPPAPATNTFIPYGSVYKETNDGYEFAQKNNDGSFNVSGGGYEYQTYKIPDNGITTFGLSNDVNNPALLRFGNYSNHYEEGATHGTMLFEGDWIALKNYYIQKGYTVKEFVKAFYNSASTALAKPENSDKTHVIYNLQGKEIKLYLFKQNNYMWKDDTSGILEYSIRLHGATKDQTYTGIAYSVDKNGNSTISENVKSIVATETDAVA